MRSARRSPHRKWRSGRIACHPPTEGQELNPLRSAGIRCRAILFDLDGVLVDSRRSVELIWEAWARRHGLDSAAILTVAHGRRTSETIREMAPHLDVATEVRLLDGLEETEQRGVAPVEGASALLAAIPRARWAVVTSGSPAVAHLRMRLGKVPAPPVLITAADVQEGKPHPEGYLRAAAALGRPPSDCLVIEDTPAGILAGRNAGMKVLAVRGTYPDQRLAAADAIVESLALLDCRISDDELAIVQRVT